MDPIDSEKDVLTILKAIKISRNEDRKKLALQQAKIMLKNGYGEKWEKEFLEELIHGTEHLEKQENYSKVKE